MPLFIKSVLEIRKEGETAENLFSQKRLSSNSAISFNKKFSECFEKLVNLFCISDELHSFFAFDIEGLKYILEKVDLIQGSKKEIMVTD